MKKIIMSVVAFAAINTSAAVQYVTVEVCGRGEAGTCEMVTYKVRSASATTPAVVTCQNGESEGACPTVYGVPAWLRSLNKAFADAGFTPAPQVDVGGPN